VKRFPSTGTQELADFFGRSYHAIAVKASKLGLEKTDEYISGITRKNGLNQRKKAAVSKIQTNDKLKSLETREDALVEWLFENHPNNPEYDSKVSELNNVRCRIYAIEKKPKLDEIGGIEVYSTNGIRI
jgi:hypothetical protein